MVSELESSGGISTETPVASRISCRVLPFGPMMYLCWDFFTSTEMVVVFRFCEEGQRILKTNRGTAAAAKRRATRPGQTAGQEQEGSSGCQNKRKIKYKQYWLGFSHKAPDYIDILIVSSSKIQFPLCNRLQLAHRAPSPTRPLHPSLCPARFCRRAWEGQETKTNKRRDRRRSRRQVCGFYATPLWLPAYNIWKEAEQTGQNVAEQAGLVLWV